MRQRGLWPRRPDGQDVKNIDNWWWYCANHPPPNHYTVARCSAREYIGQSILNFPCQKPEADCGWLYDPTIH